MSSSTPADIDPGSIRRIRPGDEPAVVALLSRALGWQADQLHEELFAWKHKWNPFGPSPSWVAEDDSGLLGFRAMMRWEFMAGDTTVPAVRAVDTATDPRARGKGIFRTLTMRAVEDLTADGTAFVFNTPNSQSTPGYLSMGWKPMGRLRVGFRPVSIGRIPNLISAGSTASDLWSTPTSVGESASSVLADQDSLSRLLAACEPSPSDSRRIRTRRTITFLQWRYGMCPVGYRAWLVGEDPEDGLVLFRVRSRGNATEVVIAELLLPRDYQTRRMGTSIRSLLRSCSADYGVALGASRPRLWLPVPRKGPLLTWRPLNWPGAPPSLNDWNLSTGDVELF